MARVNYNGPMARGWESKAVEAQQDEKAASSGAKSAKPLTSDERSILQRRRTLELARVRVQADFDASSSVTHKNMLAEALRALDAQIRELGSRPKDSVK